MSRADQFAAHPLDYLIVGGGTAGLVLANRLSEHSALTVGVIEAGPAAWDEPAINVPGRYGQAIGGQYDWKFETVAQPGLGGRKLPWPRGKVLGGTSALNFLAWNRGMKEDYDSWELLGNRGWGWEDLQRFFLRSETFHPPDAAHQKQHHSYYQGEVHGTDGPLHTTHIREYGPAHQYWHETLTNTGVETSKDSLSGSNVGAWNMVCTLDPSSQSRSYSATAYYKPIQKRPNLVVLTEATVMEVLIDQDLDRWTAKGVRVRCDGQERTINVSKEVILSAGSVQSPQLLELSGIGNRNILEAAGIKPKIHNPNVGENLQEHMMTATIFEVDPALPTRDDILNDPSLQKAADREYESLIGPWTILPCSIAYTPLSKFISAEQLEGLRTRAEAFAKRTGRPQDHILARQFRRDAGLGQIEYLFDLGNWSPYFESEPGKKYGTMLQMLQYPFSRGSIHLPPKGSGPATVDDKPVIDPRYFQGEGGDIDATVIQMGLRFADRICASQPLASIIRSRAFPPVGSKAGAADEHEEFVRNYTITDWHPIGTCAMGGSQGAKGGVVDERLRVYGVQGLRIVDASVMPLQISAHIQATVYAIAEKAAVMILEDGERGPRSNL